jgi:flavin-binding protein dodecin
MPVAVPWVTQVLALEMLAAGTVEDSVIAVDLAEETAEETLDRLAVAEVEQIRAQPIVAGVRAV